MDRTNLAEQAAYLLDMTLDQWDRGPRTLMARWYLAVWLDTGQNKMRVRQSIAWLKHVLKHPFYRKEER